MLLTLSTESVVAREHLPAIDLWFGYITGFVFFILLQTLFVIGFDKRANQLVKSGIFLNINFAFFIEKMKCRGPWGAGVEPRGEGRHGGTGGQIA
jgi:hypothetical protein